MSSLGLPSLKDFVDAMGVAWPIALTAFLGSAAVVYGHHEAFPYLVDLPRWSIASFAIVAIFSAAICVTRIVTKAIEIALSWKRSRLIGVARLKQVEMLYDLPENEHEIMSYFFSMNMRAFPALYGHSSLVGLRQKGLILTQNGSHPAINFPHYIPDHIWEAMELSGEAFTIPNVKHRRHPLSHW